MRTQSALKRVQGGGFVCENWGATSYNPAARYFENELPDVEFKKIDTSSVEEGGFSQGDRAQAVGLHIFNEIILANKNYVAYNFLNETRQSLP